MEESNEKFKPHRQILIATDGSKAAENAADFGIEIAGLSRAKVYAVYVIDITPFDSILMDEAWTKDMYEQFEKTGREAKHPMLRKMQELQEWKLNPYCLKEIRLKKF
jgi:nucleotide-binding universal stress UspA family protein